MVPVGTCNPRDAFVEHSTEVKMTVSIEKWRRDATAWTVEAIGSDGEIYQAIFAGPDAERRAREYARFKYDAK